MASLTDTCIPTANNGYFNSFISVSSYYKPTSAPAGSMYIAPGTRNAVLVSKALPGKRHLCRVFVVDGNKEQALVLKNFLGKWSW